MITFGHNLIFMVPKKSLHKIVFEIPEKINPLNVLFIRVAPIIVPKEELKSSLLVPFLRIAPKGPSG